MPNEHINELRLFFFMIYYLSLSIFIYLDAKN